MDATADNGLSFPESSIAKALVDALNQDRMDLPMRDREDPWRANGDGGRMATGGVPPPWSAQPPGEYPFPPLTHNLIHHRTKTYT